MPSVGLAKEGALATSDLGESLALASTVCSAATAKLPVGSPTKVNEIYLVTPAYHHARLLNEMASTATIGNPMKLRRCGARWLAILSMEAGQALALFAHGSPDSGPPVIGIGHKHTVTSRALGEQADLIVHLPSGYDSGEKRYPALIFLGSDNRAKFALAAATLDYMTAQGQLPAFILVGVDLPHGNFVQVPQENAEGTANADRQVTALAQDIIPFVDRTFRTNGYQILYGGSNSGLFAIFAMLSGTLPFQAYFASSPMLGWCPNLVTKRAKEAFAASDRPRRFLFVIWSDDDLAGVTSQAPNFVDLLKTSAPRWLQWKSATRHHEGHVPEMDLALSLRALFPDYNPVPAPATLRELQEHFATLSDRYGFAIDVPEALVFETGMNLVTGRHLDEAQKLFEFAVERHPRNARLHAGLGFVHRQRGDIPIAIRCLRKAIEIDPNDGWARGQLIELEPSK